jgi:hypothetical protein
VPAEGVRLAERAVAITDRKDATALDTLAAAYARADRLDDAIATAEEAVSVARASGDAQQAAQMMGRLQAYRANRK